MCLIFVSTNCSDITRAPLTVFFTGCRVQTAGLAGQRGVNVRSVGNAPRFWPLSHQTDWYARVIDRNKQGGDRERARDRQTDRDRDCYVGLITVMINSAKFGQRVYTLSSEFILRWPSAVHRALKSKNQLVTKAHYRLPLSDQAHAWTHARTHTLTSVVNIKQTTPFIN